VDSIDNAAGVLVRSAKMHDIAFPPSLRVIARAGAGVNNIPIERCTEAGIVVMNTPGANANSVKELVVAGMLLASRDLIGGASWVRDNAGDPNVDKAAEATKKAFAGHEIAGKTLGVVGLGAIGWRVANAAVALGMKVIGYDPYLSIKSAWHLSPQVQSSSDLGELVSACDFVTVHVPAGDKTNHMISAEVIARMKPNAVLLNFARDLLVDEAAVAAALGEGKLGRYVTDFANPLTAGLEGAIVLPHLGASTEEAEDNCAVMAAEQLQEYLDHGNITNSVNFPDIDMGHLETEARVCILHHNVPNILSQITGFFGSHDLNIENLVNKGRDGYAITLLDISRPMPHDTVEQLKKNSAVLRVRRIEH
jgi:D-3-phosphoglycerate dehydrogenase